MIYLSLLIFVNVKGSMLSTRSLIVIM